MLVMTVVFTGYSREDFLLVGERLLSFFIPFAPQLQRLLERLHIFFVVAADNRLPLYRILGCLFIHFGQSGFLLGFGLSLFVADVVLYFLQLALLGSQFLLSALFKTFDIVDMLAYHPHVVLVLLLEVAFESAELVRMMDIELVGKLLVEGVLGWQIDLLAP